jgi:hypothetical protein
MVMYSVTRRGALLSTYAMIISRQIEIKKNGDVFGDAEAALLDIHTMSIKLL